MRDSEAYYNNDAGFYIGQTPAQVKPIRSIVTQHRLVGQPARLERHEHALRDDHEVALLQQRDRPRPERAGLGEVPARRRTTSSATTTSSGTTSTSTRARRSRADEHGTAALAPVGTGIAAARRPPQRRREQPHLRQLRGRRRADRGHPAATENPQARALVGNVVRDNAFGLDGTDLNGRELAYDGNGTDNCFAGNTGVAVTIPADGSTLAAVPVRRRERVQPGRRRPSMLVARRRGRVAAGSSTRTRPSRASSRWSCTSRDGRRTPAAPPSPPSPRCSCAAPADAGATRSARRSKLFDNYYLPREADGQQGLDDHVEVAERRRDRRPRRQAQVGPRRACASSSPSRRRAATATSARSRSPASTRSSARCTRR